MFCCGPQHLELSIAKSQPNFDYSQLYDRKFTQIVKMKSTKHTLTKHSSLIIDSKLNHQFKIGYDKQSQFLFEVCDASKQIQLTSINNDTHPEHLWRVLSQNESHQLRVGDKIKIGFTELLVYTQRVLEQQIKESVQLNSQQHCRYCLLNTFTQQDPLVNLCKCKGSVKFLHLSCLRSWIMMKIHEEDRNNVTVYTINKLQCQLCKTNWPKKVLVHDQYQGLLNFYQSSKIQESSLINSDPFIVFQTDTLDEDELQIKVFIKIHLSGNFFFGDNENTSDLAIQTIGVSPTHCLLHSQNDQIFITDCGSMTGTLVTLHEEQIFTNKSSLFLQYSHLFVKIGLEEPFFSCFTPEQQYKLRYKISNTETKQ